MMAVSVKKENISSEMRLFSLQEPQYPQDHYWGRLKTYFQQINPLYSLYSNKKIEQL